MVANTPIGDLVVTGRINAPKSTEDRVVVGRNLDFSGPASYELDFTAINQKGIFGNVRSMFVDNSANPTEIVVSVSLTGQRFTIPPFAEGYFPITANIGSRIIIAGDGGASAFIPVAFYNQDSAPQVWYKNGPSPVNLITKSQGTNPVGTDMDTAANNFPIVIAGADPANVTRFILTDVNGRTEVHIGDAQNVAQGAIADAAYTGGATGTVIAILKGIFARLIGSSGLKYESVPAAAANQVLGGAGAIGDYLDRLIVQPATVNPGNVIINDGATPVFTFPGGAASVGNLTPFEIVIKSKSVSGAWNVTTGADVSALGVGDFT